MRAVGRQTKENDDLCRSSFVVGVVSGDYRFRRRRFLVPNEVPSTNAFCRTAPSERRSLRAICLAGTFLASDFSWRTSLFVHSRRVIFLRAAIINLLHGYHDNSR
jgi:hypothetical protein